MRGPAESGKGGIPPEAGESLPAGRQIASGFRTKLNGFLEARGKFLLGSTLQVFGRSGGLPLRQNRNCDRVHARRNPWWVSQKLVPSKQKGGEKDERVGPEKRSAGIQAVGRKET